MAVRYEHAGAAAATTLSTSITNASTTINIVSATGWPTGSVGPFVTTLDAGTASEEKVLVLSRTGTALTVSTRGYDSTTATSHASGAAIIHSFSATEADEANVAAVALTGITVVSTTGVQTLTNKTIVAASNTISGLIATAGIQTAEIATEQSTTSTTYVDLTTPGAAVTATIGSSGNALVFLSAGIENSAGVRSYIGYAVSGATTRAASDAESMWVGTVQKIRHSIVLVATGLTPGSNTFTMKYRADSGTMFTINRRITVIPL